MKRIYLLMALLVSFAGVANAQRTADLRLFHYNLNAGDTLKIRAQNPPGRIIAWGFVNGGPNAITNSDTLFLKTPYQTFRLLLPASGIPVGDTVNFIDTVAFTSGPTTATYNWCDSAWAKGTAANPVNDPAISNNKICKTMIVLNMPPTSVSELFASEQKGLNIYPNPTSGQLQLRHDFGFSATAARVRVMDVAGRLVYSEELGNNLTGVQEFSLNLSNLNAGIYFVELQAGESRATGRILIQK
jgi:hypothetical protein